MVSQGRDIMVKGCDGAKVLTSWQLGTELSGRPLEEKTSDQLQSYDRPGHTASVLYELSSQSS